MRNVYFICVAMLFCSILAPLFYDLWIYAGSGNSNFFYAITLVIGLSQVTLAIDFTFAYLRREWERANPEIRHLEVVHK
jgi:GPI-anchor transamidase subunit U